MKATCELCKKHFDLSSKDKDHVLKSMFCPTCRRPAATLGKIVLASCLAQFSEHTTPPPELEGRCPKCGGMTYQCVCYQTPEPDGEYK